MRKRDGSTLTFTYDNLNRMLVKVVPERPTGPQALTAAQTRDVYYGYDLCNLHLSARFDSQSGEGLTNVYDGFGRLTSSSTDVGGTTRILAYEYDNAGNRVRITHPDLAYFRSDYDTLSRPASIWANGATNMSGFTYYNHGAVSGLSRANGTATGYGYDGAQRLSGMVQYLAGTAHDATWGYGRNPAGGIASVSRDNNAYAWTGHYATTRAYTTNGLNQYSLAGGTSLTYDANGNLTASGSSAYVYDIENRLVGATGGAVLSYDPLGRLHQVSSTAGPTTQFLYDGQALVAEYVSGTMTRRYVHNVGADVPLLSYAGSNLSAPSYLHADERGSIVAISDASGNGTANTYDEYGIPGAGNIGRFQYTGQAWIPELGMYHYKARIYSPTLGRFMQTDPIGYGDGMNMYAYVGNDPINFTDPSGLSEADRMRVYCISDFCGNSSGGGSSDGGIVVVGRSLTRFDRIWLTNMMHDATRNPERQTERNSAEGPPPECDPEDPNDCELTVMGSRLPLRPGSPFIPSALLIFASADRDYCGSATTPGVPDMPLGVNITGACARHDACYGTLGQSKQGCDAQFRNDIYASCYYQTQSPGICTNLAHSIYVGVDLGGYGPYNDAQRAARVRRRR